MSDWETIAPQRRSSDGWETIAPKTMKGAPHPGLNIEALGETAKDVVTGKYGKDILIGGLRGAAGIGSTILSPTGSAQENQERRTSIDQFFKENANPESLGFGVGKLGTEILGTSGLPGVFAKGAQVVGAAPKIVNALRSGGFNLGVPAAKTAIGKVGDMALRTAAGGVTGAGMAGLVDPESATTGAAIGAALPVGVKAAGAAGRGLRSLAEHTLGAVTGTGAEAVKQAVKAGATGSREFLENMRGESQFDDVVAAAKQGLRNMRAERSAHYRSGMVDIKADKSVLDMTPITAAVDDLKSAGSFKGKTINDESAGVVKKIADKVEDWAKDVPAEFHTPEGLDALKQAIGDIRDTTAFGTNARRAADNVYNAIKNQIQAQAPTYSKVMKDYSEASATLSEIEGALSLGEKAKKDTAIRKLQSLMRNNAQTNYGNRLNLAQILEQKGGVDLMPAIAGQSMSSWTPRGMTGAIEKGGLLAAAALAPKTLMLAPFTSPRLMGETLYGMGAAGAGADRALGGILGGGLSGPGISAALENPAIRNALIQSYSR